MISKSAGISAKLVLTARLIQDSASLLFIQSLDVVSLIRKCSAVPARPIKEKWSVLLGPFGSLLFIPPQLKMWLARLFKISYLVFVFV